ncbi:eukaryotic-like serine/threonine-protein kinase [Cellulomonas sp. URHB0016]
MGATVTDPLVGRLVDGRYEVVSRIARGGMATVYLAVDRRLDRDVALKVMHPHLAEGSSGNDFVARFRREARAAARLTHPGLVGVYDQGLDGETSYLTMEYIDGSNLRRRLGERGALTVDETLRVGESVLDALAAAHRAGLVHRDIKPENVLLATDGRVKLADFGLARAVTEVTSTTTGTVLGTVAYLAPELVVRGASDARTDVYACGILLFEMLTGRQPFTGETPIQVAFQHVNSDVPAPSDELTWLPVEVDELVQALAARSPEDRPVDATAALGLLRRTRAALDADTLARRADVAPSIVLPLATDPDETELDELDDETGGPSGEDGQETTRLDTSSPHGATVALPIGLGVQPAAVTSVGAVALPPRHRRRWWVLLAVLTVLVLSAGGAALWYVQAGPGAFTKVPEVLGGDQATVTAALERAGLRGHATADFDPDAPVDTVFAADPEAGSRVRKGSVVVFTVSKGPDYVQVPDGVVAVLQKDAANALTTAGLTPVYDEPAYDDAAPNGVVLTATLPDGTPAAPGTQSTRGTDVTLVVSKGPAPAAITSVVGDTVDHATAALATDNMKLAATEVHDDTVAAGRIISQDPPSGTPGHRGDTVNVVVSLGPELVEMPNVVNKSVDEAKAALDALGLKVKTGKPLGYAVANRIFSQSVKAGDMIPKGTEVHALRRVNAGRCGRTNERPGRIAAPGLSSRLADQTLRRSSTTWNAISSDCWWFSRGSTRVSYRSARPSSSISSEPPSTSVTSSPVSSMCRPPGTVPRPRCTSKNPATSSMTSEKRRVLYPDADVMPLPCIGSHTQVTGRPSAVTFSTSAGRRSRTLPAPIRVMNVIRPGSPLGLSRSMSANASSPVVVGPSLIPSGFCTREK